MDLFNNIRPPHGSHTTLSVLIGEDLLKAHDSIYLGNYHIEDRASQLPALNAGTTAEAAIKHVESTTHHPGSSIWHCDPPESNFTYEPSMLDAASLRLVRVLCPASDGTVRCSISNTALNVPPSAVDKGRPALPTYTCLSYVWGSLDETRWIDLNSKPFEVRKNLWDFLNVSS